MKYLTEPMKAFLSKLKEEETEKTTWLQAYSNIIYQANGLLEYAGYPNYRNMYDELIRLLLEHGHDAFVKEYSEQMDKDVVAWFDENKPRFGDKQSFWKGVKHQSAVVDNHYAYEKCVARIKERLEDELNNLRTAESAADQV